MAGRAYRYSVDIRDSFTPSSQGMQGELVDIQGDILIDGSYLWDLFPDRALILLYYRYQSRQLPNHYLIEYKSRCLPFRGQLYYDRRLLYSSTGKWHTYRRQMSG